MTDLFDLTKIFGDVLGDTPNSLLAKGIRMAEVEQGRMADVLQPTQANTLRRAAGGLFGVDTSTDRERLKTALEQLDLQNPTDAAKAVELVRAVDPAAAGQLQQSLQAAQESSMLRQAQTFNQLNSAANQSSQVDARAAEQASLVTQRGSLSEAVTTSTLPSGPRKDALTKAVAAGNFDGKATDLIKLLSPEDKDKYKVVGQSVFNTDTATWLTPPATGAGGSLEIEKIDPDQYDSASFARYQQAVRQAETPEAGIDALKTLLPKPKDDWQWVQAEGTNSEGKAKWVQSPSGAALATVKAEIRGANNSGRTQKRRAGDVVEVLQGIEDGINSGENKTGVLGLVLARVPGTDNYTLEGDLDTIKANLGINALQEARANSASGASGFGQLTQRELERLESLVASLQTGMSKGDFLQRVTTVREDFQRAEREAKTDWTVNQWIGIEEPPAATDNSLGGITTDSIQAELNRRAAQGAN